MFVYGVIVCVRIVDRLWKLYIELLVKLVLYLKRNLIIFIK